MSNENEPITHLTLTRAPGESIFIGDNITVTVKAVQDRRVRIGISAPKSIQILRDDAKKTTKDTETE